MKTLNRYTLICLHIIVYVAVALLYVPATAAWALAVAVLLIWISVEDILSLEIPDFASASLALLGLLWLSLCTPDGLLDHFLGAVIWPLLVFGVGYGYAHVRGWAGLGFGDVKLLVGLGLWAGFMATIWVVMAASLAGMATIVLLAFIRREPIDDLATSAVAFGPFLCFSGWAVLLIGGII